MPKFNEYTEKTNPDDADIFLLQDVVSTKKTTFLGIFNQIRTKLGLGELANKNKVSQSDLEDALTEFINGKLTASGIADDLNTADITKVLSAPQGKALLGYIGTLSSLSTAQKTNLVVAINEVVTSVAALNSNIEIKVVNFELARCKYSSGHVYTQAGRLIINLTVKVNTTINSYDEIIRNLPEIRANMAALNFFDVTKESKLATCICQNGTVKLIGGSGNLPAINDAIVITGECLLK